MSTAILRSRILDMAIKGELTHSNTEEWTWDTIMNVTDPVSSRDSQIKTSEILPSGKYAVVSQGQKLIDGYCNDESRVITTLPVILFGDHTRNVKFIDFPFVVGADGTKLHKCKSIDPKFCYYWILWAADNMTNRGYERHYSLLKQTPLHLPPLPEQRRIVAKVEELLGEVDKIEHAQADITQAATILRSRVLDSALKGELTHSNTDEWEVVPLEKCAEIKDNLRAPINANERGKRLLGKKQEDLYPYYGATGQVGFIDDFLLDGDYILLGEDGAPFLDPNAPKAYLVHGKCWVNNHAHVLRALGDSKFLMYALNAINYRPFVTGTTRLKLTQGEMKKIVIPLPPLAEQRRIVAKLEQLFAAIDKLK